MTMPKLTELQIAALACVRDNRVIPRPEPLGRRTILKYRAFPKVEFPINVRPKDQRGFDVTSQIGSFRKRRLVRLRERLVEGPLYKLSPAGFEELDKHPEF